MLYFFLQLSLSLSLSLTFRVRTAHIWIIFISSLSMPAAFSSSCSSLRHTYCNRENDKYWIHHPKVLNNNNGKHVTVLRQNVLFNGPYMSNGKSFHPFLILLFFFVLFNPVKDTSSTVSLSLSDTVISEFRFLLVLYVTFVLLYF